MEKTEMVRRILLPSQALSLNDHHVAGLKKELWS